MVELRTSAQPGVSYILYRGDTVDQVDAVVGMQLGLGRDAIFRASEASPTQAGFYRVTALPFGNPAALHRAGVSLWTFNEREGSTEFADLFGARWPLLLSRYEHGLPQSGIATRFGHGLRFQGTNPPAQTLLLPREIAPITPPFTLGFWFQLGETSKLTSILASGTFGKDGLRMGLVPRPNATLVGAWTTQSGGTLELFADANIQIGDWHHLALTYDGTTAVLYVDGKRSLTQDRPVIIPPAIGGYVLQGGSSTSLQTFQGLVDEWLVADSVLTDAEISGMVTAYLRSGMFTLVDGGNKPVMASIPDMTVRAGETLEVAVPVFDADYDLEVLTAAPMPSGATLDPVTRTFRWTPGFQQTGVYPVTLAAFDRRQHFAEQSFNIRVLPGTAPAPTALFRYSIPSTAYPVRQPQLIQILTGAPGGLGREGVHIMLGHASDPAAPLRIVGLHGEEVYTGPFGVMPLLPAGHYFVETPGDRTQLLILPSDYSGSSFMGFMADRPDDPEARSRSAVLQPAWRRLGSQITWSEIEKSRGTYDWTQLDAWIAANRVNGGKALIILVDSFPLWLRGASEEVFLAEVTRYARDYIARNRNQIDVLEPFNEPSLDPSKLGGIAGMKDDDFERAAALLTRAYAAIAGIARQTSLKPLPLAGPTWQGLGLPYDRLQIYMGNDGFAPLVDAGDLHDYVMGRRAPDAQAAGRHYNLPQAVSLVRNNTDDAPFFVSEIGLHGVSALGYEVDPDYAALEPYGVTGLSWWLGYRRTLISTIMYHGLGATSVLPHDFNVSYGIEISGRDPGPSAAGRGFKPQASGFIAVCRWLDGAKPVTQLLHEGRVFAYGVTRANGENVVFAWTHEGETVPIDPARRDILLKRADLRVHDVFGREFAPDAFGEEPLVFRSSLFPASLLASTVAALEDLSCDGVIEAPAEECDCRNLGGATCESLGYGPGVLRCSETNTFDVSACRYADPQALLTAYYPLDELAGTTVADASGHDLAARLLTPTLSRSWVNSRRGRVLHFEGVPSPVPQEELIIPNRAFQVLPRAGKPFTIALWVDLGDRQPSRWMSIMGCEDYPSSGFRLGILPTGQLGWWTSQDQGDVDLFTLFVPTLGVWHHVAVTYEPGRVRLFVDGALAMETSNSRYLPTAADIRVGDAIDGDPIDPFKGELDDLRFYSRALTPSEVGRLANP
jgi:hypothetical protein